MKVVTNDDGTEFIDDGDDELMDKLIKTLDEKKPITYEEACRNVAQEEK